MSNDDPLVFFQSYERALLLNDVEKSQWSKFLPANLTPKANKVLAGMSLQDVKDYELCKRTILSYFQLNGEAYLKKFRSAHDRQSSERHLEPNDLALILMPTNNVKLTATWKGPYKVVRRGDNNNYVVDVDGRHALLHINALRKYHQSEEVNEQQTETVNLIISGDTDLQAEAVGERGEPSTRQGERDMPSANS